MNSTSESIRDNNGGKIQGDSPRIMTTPHSNRTRILVADDQPDIREALRLLLKGEGFEVETVASPAAVLSALEAREFDGVLMDLNYARDTTSGQEGLDLLSNIRAKDSTLPDHRDDRLGQPGTRRGSDAPRRARISSRSRGRTRGCSPSCEHKSSFRKRCAKVSVSKPKTACCAPMDAPL